MLKNEENSYFSYVLFIFIFAIGFFYIFKWILPEKLFPENNLRSPNITVDSLAMNAMIETSNTLDSVQNTIIGYEDSLSTCKYLKGIYNLSRFYSKLDSLQKKKTGKVRIAYFSDSMADGDLIVQDIRKLYQERYGGKGVGFVGITSISAQSRYSVSHYYSQNWNSRTLLKQVGSGKFLGIDGQVSFAPGNNVASVEYRANDFPFSTQLYNPTLFFGTSKNNKAYVRIIADRDSIVSKRLSPFNTLNTLSLSNRNPSRLRIEFFKSDSIPFYGINFDNETGVYIDNLSIRGNSGLPLSVLNMELMKAFDSELNYNLIVLHYGANVLTAKTTDYSWYEKKMRNVVEHLKKCFPNADFLIISTADKSSRQNTEMKTDKAVLTLIEAQKQYARNTGSAFLNLFELMGGDGSMVKWVKEKPAMANKDYTHFNINGSRKIASLIFEEMENGVTRFRELDGSKSIYQLNENKSDEE